VAGGYAEFVLTGDLQIGVAVDARKADGKKIGYLVTEKGDTGTAQGDVLRDDEIIATTQAAAIVDPQGSRIELAPGTRARVEVPPDMPVPSRAPYAGTVDVTAGRARVVVPPPVADAPKLIKLTLKGNAGQFDVKGTAFNVTTCGIAPNVIDVVEVGEGVVGASAGTKTQDVGAGESAAICTNCSQAAIDMCTPPPDDAGPPLTDDDGGPVAVKDAGGADTTVTGGPDAGAGDDTGSVATDGPGGTTTDAPVVPPDAGLAPDAPIAPDLAPPVDKAPLPPDTATLPPDAATLPPDGAPLMPDAAQLPPDAAQLPPDAAPPPPDAFPAAFILNPGKQDFGSVTIGVTSASVNVTVTNGGDLPSGVPTVKVSGDFVLGSNGCMNSLASNTSCLVAVAFKPTVAGARSGALTVITAAGNVATATLSGTGVAPQPAQFALKPLAFDFGWKQEGAATGDIIFTLTNTGGMDSAVPVISLGGAKDFAFNVAAPRGGFCPNKLAAGASCTMSLHFIPAKTDMPTMNTQRTATLSITGSPGGTASARLSGDATVTNGLLLLPPHHDFGIVPVGQQSARFTYVLSNPSNQVVTNLAFSQVGNGIYAIILPPPLFQIVDATDCTSTHKNQLGPQESCNIVFAYNPNANNIGLKQLMWQATGNLATGAPAVATAHVQGTGM
jgi:hypothetical protein